MDIAFANHLHFMWTHRGAVRFSGCDVHIDSPAPGFSSFVPGSVQSQVPESCSTVRLAPWSGGTWPERLMSEGFLLSESLNYMELANPYVSLASGDTSDVRVATTEEAARSFAMIQSVGFSSGKADSDAWWKDYFCQQALQNYGDPDQTFYLGCLDGQPVTSTLVICHAGVLGIYAVATRPEYRNKGMGRAVIERVRRDALRSGHSRLILQALVGSYAEAYYGRLGFCSRFRSHIWRCSLKQP